jgi:hypothetical protein
MILVSIVCDYVLGLNDLVDPLLVLTVETFSILQIIRFMSTTFEQA